MPVGVYAQTITVPPVAVAGVPLPPVSVNLPGPDGSSVKMGRLKAPRTTRMSVPSTAFGEPEYPIAI